MGAAAGACEKRKEKDIISMGPTGELKCIHHTDKHTWNLLLTQRHLLDHIHFLRLIRLKP